MKIEFPLVTVNPLNRREHWGARSRRVKNERKVTHAYWRLGLRQVIASGGILGHPPLVVLLTRIAPFKLDPGDNLAASLKGVRDQVAAELGIADRDPRVAYEYAQEKGKPAVRIEVRSA